MQSCKNSTLGEEEVEHEDQSGSTAREDDDHDPEDCNFEIPGGF